MASPYENSHLISGALSWKSVTPSDTVNIPGGVPKGIYVGVAGNIALVSFEDVAVTLANVPVGVHPLRPKRINSTGTTATNIVALY